MCDKSDFPVQYFPLDWDVVYNRLGDGYRIQYPVFLKPAVQWTRKAYAKDSGGSLVEKPRFCMEVVNIKLNKVRCN